MMEKTDNYLQILSESLDKKIVILEELERLTDEQKKIAEAEEFDDTAFEENVNQKAGLIEEIEKLDEGFEILYGNVKNQIDGKKDIYKTQISMLQEKIKKVMDESVAIQAAESSNKVLIEKRFTAMKKEVYRVKKNRQMAASYYKTMNNITTDPFFMDKKQ